MYEVFQVWIEAPDQPSETIIGYMSSNINKIPAGCSYKLISTSNYFSGDARVTWVDVAGVISEMHAEFPLISGNFWDAIPVRLKSDLVRFYCLSKSGNAHYIDCDVEVLRFPGAFSRLRVPYFAITSGIAGNCDIYAINQNHSRDWFISAFYRLAAHTRLYFDTNGYADSSVVFYYVNSIIGSSGVKSLSRLDMIHHSKNL